MDDLPDLAPELYAALRDDIAHRGVLVPILRCAQTDEILDGKLRKRICDDIGIRDIPTMFVSQLSEEDRHDIRVACNVYRRQLTRKQLQVWVDYEVTRTPHQSDRRIAGRIGVSDKTIAAARRRSAEVPQFKFREGQDGKFRPGAKPSVFATTKGTGTVVRKILTSLGDDAPRYTMSARAARKALGRRDRENQRVESVSLPGEFTVRCCDFRKHGLAPGSVDLVTGDPPWKEDWAPHRADFAQEVLRVLRPGGVLACYTGQMNLPAWLIALESAGLRYEWLIASLNNGHAGAFRSLGSISSQWRPIALFSKPGGRRFKSPQILSDVLTASIQEKKHHEWQQPVSESVELISCLSKPGDLIADLTCGSGSSGVACGKVSGRRYFGCDLDAGCVKITRRRIYEVVGSKIAKIPATAALP